jgi:hypothetical protein
MASVVDVEMTSSSKVNVRLSPPWLTAVTVAAEAEFEAKMAKDKKAAITTSEKFLVGKMFQNVCMAGSCLMPLLMS